MTVKRDKVFNVRIRKNQKAKEYAMRYPQSRRLRLKRMAAEHACPSRKLSVLANDNKHPLLKHANDKFWTKVIDQLRSETLSKSGKSKQPSEKWFTGMRAKLVRPNATLLVDDILETVESNKELILEGGGGPGSVSWRMEGSKRTPEVIIVVDTNREMPVLDTLFGEAKLLNLNKTCSQLPCGYVSIQGNVKVPVVLARLKTVLDRPETYFVSVHKRKRDSLDMFSDRNALQTGMLQSMDDMLEKKGKQLGISLKMVVAHDDTWDFSACADIVAAPYSEVVDALASRLSTRMDVRFD